MTSYFGRKAAVPVNLTGNGLSIAANAFSMDFDTSCLHFDPAAAVDNGAPNGSRG